MNEMSKPEPLGFTEHTPAPKPARNQDQGGKKTAQRDRVIDAVVNAGAIFWKDPDGTAYATLPREGRIERYKVRSSGFRAVVRALYAEACPRMNDDGMEMPGSISDKAMTEALPSLEAMVHQRGTETRMPALRSIMLGETIWLDLGSADWSLVKITRNGWEIVAAADVPLVRADAMRALPVPDRAAGGAALNDLRRLLNLGDKQTDDFMLIVCWLLGCLWPTGPYPILAIDGEQGSGKSTLSRLLRGLVDPNKAALRAPPRTESDLIVAANAGRVVALDNVSFIDADMADVLCRLATGAGLSKRRLYTDEEEHLIEVCRPILLNGINSVMSRGDVADRAMVATLPRIPDAARRLEADIERDFQRAAPGILAMLLNAMSEALHYDRRVPMGLPRMADFAAMACRAAPAFGWKPEVILNAINENREAANIAVVEADPLSDALSHILHEHGYQRDDLRLWEGTAAELLDRANAAAPESVKREKGWPKDPTRLSQRLRRLAPALRRCGIDVTLPEAGGREGRKITVKQRSQRSQRSMQENTGEKRNASQHYSVPAAFPAFPEPDSQRSQTGGSVPQRSTKWLKSAIGNAGNAGNANLPYLSPAQTPAPDEVEI